jgi:hypothetical protein
MMAYDAGGVQVFFGGEDSVNYSLAYGNTVECR